jgi:UDP-N-acetylmuramate dehydrogenase
MLIKKEFSLKNYNTFGIDINAKNFAEVTGFEEIKELFEYKDFYPGKSLILGGGSNMLLTKDYDGTAVKVSIMGIEEEKEDSSQIYIRAGAGVAFDEFVGFCVSRNYGGVENLSLIPGCVGAAPVQNIGAYGSEVKDVIQFVEAVDMFDGSKIVLSNDECRFGYRDSIFKRGLKSRTIITSVVFKLNKNSTPEITYDALKKEADKRGLISPSIKDIRDMVISVRQSKLPDYTVLGNSGSFFKNPEISQDSFATIQTEYPAVKGYQTGRGTVKMPAGWMIESCGWKGRRLGNCGVYEKQALIIVNFGGATGQEVFDLSEKIITDVKNKFGVVLEREVNVI